MADLGGDVALAIVAAVVAAEGPCGTIVASVACVDCEWHAVVVAVAAVVAEATVAGGGSSGSDVDCGAAVVVAFAAAAVVTGVPPVLDYHCVLGTAAFAVGILSWKRKTSATLEKGAAVVAVVAAGYCHLSGLACPGVSSAVASVDPGAVASDSRECYHRAFPVVGDHRASAGGSAAVAERSGDPARIHAGGHFPCDDGAVSEAGVLAIDCAAVEEEDAIR